MEPTSKQFPAIYRKGGDQSELSQRANKQHGEEKVNKIGMTAAQEYDYDVKSGLQGAKNIVNLNPTAQEAIENPGSLGGPVSGAALAKLKVKKVNDKKTKERELKRR
jgi:hypothetical protein